MTMAVFPYQAADASNAASERNEAAEFVSFWGTYLILGSLLDGYEQRSHT